MISRRQHDWCCDGFRNAVTFRNEAGMFIFATEPEELGQLHFLIGFNSVDRKDKASLVDFLKQNPLPINFKLAGCIGLKFCPWCGTRLERFYRHKKHLVIDVDLAKEWEPPRTSDEEKKRNTEPGR